jgi:uncharacterized protein
VDIDSLKYKLLPIIADIESSYVRIDAVILFGSHAKKLATEESDIDLAFVSKDFGIDRVSEGATLSKFLFRKILGADPIPVPLKEFLNPQTISPIVAEIKATGIAVF